MYWNANQGNGLWRAVGLVQIYVSVISKMMKPIALVMYPVHGMQVHFSVKL